MGYWNGLWVDHQVLLRCPNYPAWSAYCKRLQLAVDCQEQATILGGIGYSLTTLE